MSLRNIKNHVQAVRQNKGILYTDQIHLVSRATAPSDSDLADGRFYIDSATTQAFVYLNSAWVDIGAGAAGGASDWDTLYQADKSCTISSTTLSFAGTHATGDVITLTNASGSGSCLQITNSGTGSDIKGSSATWSISKAGALAVNGAVTCGDITRYGAGANQNFTIDAKGSGTLTLQGTATGAITLTTAVTATASITITGAADTDVFTITAGDVAISNGLVAITSDDTATGSLTLTSAATSGTVLLATANDLANGWMVILDSDTEATFGTGGYFQCYDGGAATFSIVADGATTIAGNAAGTDAFTITAGDILLDDSDNNVIESEDGILDLLLLDNKAGAVGSGKAVLKVDAGGVVNAAGFGIYAAFTGAAAAGATVVGVVPDAGSLGVKINGGGIDTREALYVDADPTAYDVVYLHSDAVIASDKAILNITSAGAIASGGNGLRLDITGTPASGAVYCEFDFAGLTDTNENVGVLIDAGGKKVQALYIDADPAASDVVYIHTDAAIANNKAVLSLHDAGTPGHTGSNLLRLEFAGTDTNKHTLVEIIGAGKDCEALDIDADPTTKDVMYVHTDAVIADNKAVLSLHTAGAMAAGSSILRLAQAGTPAAATSYTFEIDNSGGTLSNNPVCVRINAHDSTGATIQATSAGAAVDLLDLYSTNTGATGVKINTTHTSTGSAAANDAIFLLSCDGLDAGDAATEYTRLEAEIMNATAGQEDGRWVFSAAADNSTMTQMLTINPRAGGALAELVVGSGAGNAYVTSSGAYDLILDTNEGTDSSSITITDAANGDITLAINGTGNLNVQNLTYQTNAGSVVASTTTLTWGDAEGQVVFCTSAGGAYSVTLPAAATAGAGAWYTFIKTDADANAITLDGNGAETIGEAGSAMAATYAVIDAIHDTVTIVCDGTSWYVTAQNLG